MIYLERNNISPSYNNCRISYFVQIYTHLLIVHSDFSLEKVPVKIEDVTISGC